MMVFRPPRFQLLRILQTLPIFSVLFQNSIDLEHFIYLISLKSFSSPFFQSLKFDSSFYFLQNSLQSRATYGYKTLHGARDSKENS
jgi:hypothetical protein